MAALRWISLALLLCMIAGLSNAQDGDASDAIGSVETSDDFDNEPINDDEDEEEEDTGAMKGIDARVMFVNHPLGGALTFPAGEKVETFVSLQNKPGNPAYDIFIVAAHINRIGDPNAFVQNYSAVRSIRNVPEGTTATVKYDFVPDAMLEPMDYNLVVRLFFINDENTTFAAIAYNQTISISDPLGTDPKTVMTFVIIFGLMGAAVYYFATKPSTTVRPKRAPEAKKSDLSSVSGTGKGSATYDKAAIPKEHLKYMEALEKRKATNKAQSPTRPQ